MALPLALVPWVELRFLLADGAPNAGGFVKTYVAGTTTPLETYTGSDVDTDPANPTTIELDADGRPPDPIFLLPRGYKFIVEDADNVELYSIDNIEDVGATAFATLGQVLADGARDRTDGYVITDADNTITVLPAASPDPCEIFLPAAADRGLPLTVINVGTVDVALTPDGSDTINGASGALTIPAGTTPVFAGATLNADGVSNWLLSAYWE